LRRGCRSTHRAVPAPSTAASLAPAAIDENSPCREVGARSPRGDAARASRSVSGRRSVTACPPSRRGRTKLFRASEANPSGRAPRPDACTRRAPSCDRRLFEQKRLSQC
jgi:hypothetical protein